MATLAICGKKRVLCADCTDKACARAGDKGADCPKYRCDNAVAYDCGHCEYINGYIRTMRAKFRSES